MPEKITKKTSVLGVKLDAISKNELNDKLDQLSTKKDKAFIFTINSEFIIRAYHDKEFRHILNSGALNLADGVGPIWAAKFKSFNVSHFPIIREISIIFLWLLSILAIVIYPKFLKKPLPDKISGSDFVWDFAKYAKKNNYKIFLLGGGTTVAERAALKLQTDIYGLKIAGVSSLDPKDSKEIIRQVNKSRANILLVAYGSPKQEYWLKDNLNKTTCQFGAGLGGTFDFLAGVKKRAPKIMQNLGLEWLFRLIYEPKRLKRQLAIPKLMFLMLYRKLFIKEIK